MNNNCYGICFTPETYSAYINWWNSFPDINKNIILDNSKNQLINYDAFIYTEKDIRNNFNFTNNVSKNHYWNHHGNRNIIWFYAYLRMINFYLKNNTYDYYWFFDDDVYCDNWPEFLKSFDTDDSDFLSYFLFKDDIIKNYNNVPSVNDKMFSGKLWFSRFPGHNDILEPGITDYFGSFFAIVRFSNKALKLLVDLTLNGFSGYGEGFVPTELANHGMKLNSIFNSENKSKYFDVDQIKILHKNQKITWEWL